MLCVGCLWRCTVVSLCVTATITKPFLIGRTYLGAPHMTVGDKGSLTSDLSCWETCCALLTNNLHVGHLWRCGIISLSYKTAYLLSCWETIRPTNKYRYVCSPFLKQVVYHRALMPKPCLTGYVKLWVACVLLTFNIPRSILVHNIILYPRISIFH